MDIRKMKYSWNVATEVLRFRPPSPGAFREAKTDFTLTKDFQSQKGGSYTTALKHATTSNAIAANEGSTSKMASKNEKRSVSRLLEEVEEVHEEEISLQVLLKKFKELEIQNKALIAENKVVREKNERHPSPGAFKEAKTYSTLMKDFQSQKGGRKFQAPPLCPGLEYDRLEILVFMHNVVTTFKWEEVLLGEKIIVYPIPAPAKGLPIQVKPHTFNLDK
ncbi:hypothetical protein IFM89_008209 [Coptis chinensis]|uniref:Uncharacterized protein n=1 Tax=Coptis chinensis TaxID=261450 RepID=A0A835GX99_9MAGN|nr:hypothetical protein IFM89_008209 [Coptis chinensis]